MQPSGKPERVAPSIGLYFGDHGSDPDAVDAAARTAEYRHRRRAMRATSSPTRTCCRSTSRCRRCSRTRTIGCADARGEATLPDGTTRSLDRDQGLGFPVAARLPLRNAGASAEGHDAVDALRLRQLGGEPAQPAAAAGARALGAAIVGRDGRSVDSGADARRRRPGAAQPRLPARRWSRKTCSGYEVEIEKHPDDPGLHDDAALLYLELGRADESDRALRDVAGAEAGLSGRALQPRHRADRGAPA